MKKTVLIPVKPSVLHKPHECSTQHENMLIDDIQVRQESLLLILTVSDLNKQLTLKY